MDRIDRRILAELQRRADLPLQELGNRVGLSQTPCWRRIKRLEQDGVIRGRVALLDPRALDLAVTVFVEVQIDRHSETAELEAAVRQIPQIVECYALSGDTDFLMRLVVSDVAAYEQLLQSTLLRLPHIYWLRSSFALREVKYTTELPIP